MTLNSQRLFSALGGVVALVVAGCAAAGLWIWLFYGASFAQAWRREYVQAALALVILGSLALLFTRERRTGTVRRATFRAATSLGVSLAVVAIVYVATSWILSRFLFSRG